MCFSVELEKDLSRLALRFSAEIEQLGFEKLLLDHQRDPGRFKVAGSDNRIFPQVFAPVIIEKAGKRIITPMRYRLRPAGSLEEVPAKFNLYNARKDSLQERKSWKQLLGKSHGIFPFKSFFEWVKDAEGKSQLINFFPKEREVMWAPCLYDSWSGPKLVGNGKEHFSSFALITDGPAPEVAEQGHDRCPLFLKESQITQWLAPSASNPQDLVELLNQQEEVTYLHSYLEKTSNSGGENSQLKLF